MVEFFDIPHIITTYGYVGIFIVVFLESGIFFALPGDSLLFTAGLFTKSLHLSLPFLISVIFIGTVLGTLAGYHIGFHLKKLHRYAFFQRIIKREHLDKAHDFFERHGRSAIFFSHFFPLVRTFVPIVAGIVVMRYALFVKYTLISSLVWATGVTLAGYFLGEVFPNAKNYIFLIVILTVLVSSLPMIYEWIKKRKA